MSKKFKAVLFDLDGCLVDTAEFHYQAWQVIANALGEPFDKAKNERLRGVPRMASLEIIVEDMAQPPANMDELATRKNEIYVDMIKHITPADLLPGVKNLLDALKDAGIKIALGSSSKNAKPVLKSLDIEAYFDAVVDGHGFEFAKPAPDVFVNGANLLGLDIADCIVVEDAPAGVEAGKAAGAFVVGIARDEPLPGADLIVSCPSEIPYDLWI